MASNPYAGMAPDFATRLRALIAASGGRVHILSGTRTRAQQEALFRRYGPGRAARPGHSNHERGLAADLNGDLALAHRLAPQFGLHFPVRGEAWHVEGIGVRNAINAGVQAGAQSAGVQASTARGTLTADQIAQYAYQAGFRGQGLLRIVAIAFAESGGRTNARGDVGLQTAQWGPSIGLTQVRSLNNQRGKGGQRDELANADPLTNMRNAFAISNGGTNFRPWSTFTSGKYQNFLGKAQTGIMHVDPNATLKGPQDAAAVNSAHTPQTLDGQVIGDGFPGADPHDIGTHLRTLTSLFDDTSPADAPVRDPHDIGSQVQSLSDLLSGVF